LVLLFEECDFRLVLYFQQLAPEPLYLPLVLEQQRVLGVLVDDWGVGDVFGLRGVLERRERLLYARVVGGDVPDHYRFRVTA
jgi:hypothetical protein